mgnify:CR=1 FL=1
MATITGITIDGNAVDLSTVVYDVQVTHGRATITDDPTASTCDLTLITHDTELPDVELGDPIVVQAYGSTRFTGKIADAALTHVVDDGARLAITATGKLTDLATIPVTPTAWPEETSGVRAGRILDDAGVTVYAAAGDLTVLAQTADEASALELLTQLASDTGAAVFDTPGGGLVFQDLAGRAQRYIDDIWTSMTSIWSATSGTWADQDSPAVSEPVDLPADAVAWSPTFEKHLGDIVNRVVVNYGAALQHIEDDTASQTAHGIRSVTLDTQLAYLADAQLRAEQVVARLANPRYQLSGVSVLVHDLDAPTRTAVLGLRCGDRAIVLGLPRPAPTTDWLGVVEGWSEQYSLDRFDESTAVESHILTLALSDPRASFATVQWSAVTGTRTWSNIHATVPWTDVTADTDLAA